MEFQVPQFIEQKPKIIGPLTLIQFFYLAGAAAVSFIAYNIFSGLLWALVTLIAVGIAVALAFVKVNGQDMIKVMSSLLKYSLNQRTYTWQRQAAKTTLELSDEDLTNLRKKIGVGDRLKSLALKVTVGKIFSKEKAGGGGGKEKYEVVTYLTGERKVAKRIDY